MNFSLYAPLRCTALMAVAVLAASLSTGAMALPKAMANSQLSEVVGCDGVSIIADINVNSSQVSHIFHV